MMMHPNDFEKLLFIAKVFLIIGMAIYSFKLGRIVFMMVMNQAYRDGVM
jgi:hypothetical protein